MNAWAKLKLQDMHTIPVGIFFFIVMISVVIEREHHMYIDRLKCLNKTTT